ncbi:MAG TPA: DUF2786 domain-containing protein [Acetobacterium sp.]
MDSSIRKRIKKLLALGKSPNQNEANCAILKAKQLMAEHKMTDRDFIKKDENPIKIDSNLYFTTRKDLWMTGLADVIAENNCCVFYMITPKASQKHYIIFYGYEEDVTICVSTFCYAVDCIRTQLKSIVKALRQEGETTRMINNASESFGIGFFQGLVDAYELQDAENQQWGLAMVVPPEVLELVKTMTPSQHKAGKHENNQTLYTRGYQEGKVFTIQDKLENPA